MLISHIVIDSWEELGQRIAAARQAAGFTQADLASKVDLERTAVVKLEKGSRQVSTLELARIAEVLQRPIPWFLSRPSQHVVSRRNARGVEKTADVLLELLVADVEQLVQMGLLRPERFGGLGMRVESVEDAERAAGLIRARVGDPAAPIVDLVAAAERVGLYAFVLELEANVEGSYVALEGGAGVALVQGRDPSGKRRFTLAHELGHHVFSDEYSEDWVTGGKEESERLINAFAAHFLLPRKGVGARWRELGGETDPRNAAIHLGAEYGVSWSALCAQLENLGVVDGPRSEALRTPPTAVDFLERGLELIGSPAPPAVPRGVKAAVASGYKRRRLGRERAVELLRGTVAKADLPELREVPLEAMARELGPLGDR